MRKIIHHIRRQPEKVKRHVLHVLIVVAGVVLVLLWIYSLGTTLSSPDNQAKMKQDLQPFTSLQNNTSIPSSW